MVKERKPNFLGGNYVYPLCLNLLHFFLRSFSPRLVICYCFLFLYLALYFFVTVGLHLNFVFEGGGREAGLLLNV